MKVQFQYDKEKDVWCLLNKGKSSNNSQKSTKQYVQLIATYGDNPTEGDISNFVESYTATNNINIPDYIEKYQEDWDTVSGEFQKRAEAIFGVSLPENVTGYLTINSRCPYSIDQNYFFVAVSAASARSTTMHELWHFYTWYGLGTDQEEKLGKQKYNEIKEALTVLLNVECKDLLPEGVVDSGYPEHQELRREIVELWGKDRDINKLWASLTQEWLFSRESLYCGKSAWDGPGVFNQEKNMEQKSMIVGVLLFIVGLGFGYLFWGGDGARSGMHMMPDGSAMSQNIDQHFIVQMIPHHEGAIAMAQVALEKSKRPEVVSLANAIIEAQQKEINDMSGWYQSWYGSAPPSGGMGGMHMGGMEGDLEKLKTTAASEFDQEFVQQMIPHHEMAIMMAQMLQASTKRSEMKELAGNIITSQSQEIDLMRSWLASWEN